MKETGERNPLGVSRERALHPAESGHLVSNTPRAFLHLLGVATPPRERLLVKRILGAWHCSLFLSSNDWLRLDAIGPAAVSEAARACGVYAVIALLEWRLSDDEAAAVETFAARRSVMASLPEVAQSAVKLREMDSVIAMERNLVRSPVFQPSGGEDAHLVLSDPIVVGSLHRRPFSIAAPHGPPTARDGLLLAELVKMYADQGFPESRAVAVSVADLCAAAGYADRGGWQSHRVSDALMRLRSVTLRSVVRLEDGREEVYVWGLVDAGLILSGDVGQGQIRLSEELASLIRRGLLVYLNRAVFHELVAADEYAARLWMFLEGERLTSTPRRYSIFSAPAGKPAPERDSPAIADLLGLRERRAGVGGARGWTRRRDIVRRIRRAADELQQRDPTYAITIEQAKSHPAMKNLCVARIGVQSVTPTHPVDDSTSAVYEESRLCVRGVASACTASRAAGGEVPASRAANSESTVSSAVSSTVKEDYMTGAVAPDTDTQEQSLESSCTTADILRYQFGYDTLDGFSDLFASDRDRVLTALAAAVCRQFRRASGGTVCRGNAEGIELDGETIWAAEFGEDGTVAWCPAWDAFHDVVIKATNYVRKHRMPADRAVRYVGGCIRHANADPTDMMGRTREESKAAYREMTALHEARREGLPRTSQSGLADVLP